VAGVLSLAVLGWTVLHIRGEARMVLLGVGQFLTVTKLIRLYEHRSNRDYAQVLIMSLLLMVAASILSTGLAFGVLFVAYLVLAFYCCLLFHLKVEIDRATAAQVISPQRSSPMTLRQDQLFLLRSMRRATLLVSLAACAGGVAVFVLFPRGPAGGMFAQIQFRGEAGTGFSERMSLEQIVRIRENNEVVATVTVFRNERPVPGTATLYLRGLTVDVYGVERAGGERRPQWVRAVRDLRPLDLGPDSAVAATDTPHGNDVWRQHVVLNPGVSRYLFLLPGLILQQRPPRADSLQYGHLPAVEPTRALALRYSPSDDSLHRVEPPTTQIEYQALSTNGAIPRPDPADLPRRPPILTDPQVLAPIRQYVLDLDLVPPGTATVGLEEAEATARRFEAHLRSGFTYTLDLTDATAQFRDLDPVVAFLTRVKRGHCEYFASAMTLMCQSVGIPARVVQGFRADGEAFNPIGGYYVVRQSMAHAWVEAYTERGWVTFDPTSGRQAAARPATAWQMVRHLFNYLEHLWTERVIAFNNRDRDALLKQMRDGFDRLVVHLADAVQFFRWLREMRFLDDVGFWQFFLRAIIFLIIFGTSAIFALVAWFLYQQSRLRQRAQRIGLGDLPVAEQIRLARELGFYDALTGLLHRAGLRRPPHLTPREWAASLVVLPAPAYRDIRRLTDIFYDVRFGRRQLSPRRQRHLLAAVQALARATERH
jgi:transglutaminase-like putative cysteine protease